MQPLKLTINPEYLSLEPFLRQLPTIFPNEGTTIHHLRNELKVFDTVDGPINVKRYRRPILLNRFAYTYIRKSKARRAFENAGILLSKSIGTPVPIAYLELFERGLLSDSYFVSVQIEDARRFTEFSDGSSISGREDILQAFEEFAAKMHQSNIFPLDLSIGNVLFRKEKDQIHFWMVDLNRMKFCPIDWKMGCANFERLRGERRFFEEIIGSYAAQMGYDAEKSLELVLSLAERSKKRFDTKYQRKKARRRFRQQVRDKFA